MKKHKYNQSYQSKRKNVALHSTTAEYWKLAFLSTQQTRWFALFQVGAASGNVFACPWVALCQFQSAPSWFHL